MSTVRDYISTLEKALDVAEGTETDFEVVDGIEEKVRRIRTPEGARRFGAPIGSIIRADGTVVPPKGGGGKKPESSSDRAKREISNDVRRAQQRAAKKPSSAPDRVKPSSASSAKMGRKKNVDGWEVYPVRIGSDEYGITNDGNGWYPYKGEHDYIGDDYYDSPKEALEALENWHGDSKAKGNSKPKGKASVFKPGDIVSVGGGDARYEIVKIDGDDVHLKNVDEDGRGGKRVLKASQITPVKKGK